MLKKRAKAVRKRWKSRVVGIAASQNCICESLCSRKAFCYF